MTSNEKITKIIKVSEAQKPAYCAPSIVEKAAMGRESVYSRAVHDLTNSPALDFAKAQSKSPFAEMLATMKADHLAFRNVEKSQVIAAAKALRGIGDGSALAKALLSLRSSHWQLELGGLNSSILGAIARQQSELQNALSRISDSGAAAAKVLALAQPNLRVDLQTAIGGLGSLDMTNKRFAALAGITDVYGIGTLHRQTTETLLGRWHTDLKLPKAYWRDFEYRRSLYREAEVDEGLIEADLETTIEMSIATGAIVGEIVEEGCYIIGETASGLLKLTTSNLALDIFKLVGTIETSLRSLIANKLDVIAGQKWFTQRVPGNLVAKARETRQKALKAGEPQAPLIEFLTLGELMEVVLRTDNWENVFEPIFRNRDWFKRDIEVIGVARNSNAHYRANDSLRLTEAMIVWQRLSSYIKDDGQWRADAQVDE